MTYKVLFIIICILLLGIIAVVIGKKLLSNINSVSFEDSFKKANLPIITFYNDCFALNFLIDTGSTFSCIDSNILRNLHYKNTNAVREVVSVNGTCDSPVILMSINDSIDCVDELFTVVDMSGSNAVNDGIVIHGILGSTFCKKAGFIIDYKSLKVHS